jgi:mono/diheme cytochrome c family protein
MRIAPPLCVLACLLSKVAFAQGPASPERVERGRYLAVLGDCAGCHTAPGGQPFAGGLPLQTPFGTLVAPNITPDRETGIGAWTEKEFVSTLHNGRGRGGERLYPAMPYPAYTKMSVVDVLAMRAYFLTVAPVSNKVISNKLPFPFNIRQTLIVWNWLNFSAGRYQTDPQKSAEWNRGAEIVNGAGHCGTCHTPKSALGGDKTATPLTGATLQGWFAPDISTNPTKGIGGWSNDDIVQYLKTGANSFTLAFGPMAEVVSNSTSQLNDQDLSAIATYLKDGKPVAVTAPPKPLAATTAVMRAGAAIYKDNCAACHKDAGTGETHLIGSLVGSSLVLSDDPTTLARIVLEGARALGTATRPTAPAMPAFNWRLNDNNISAVLTYIRNSWGNAALPIAAGKISDARRASMAAR